MRCLIRALALSLVLSAAVQADQNGAPPSVERQIYVCFDQGDYAQAVGLIETYLEHSPNDADMLYNLACAHCRLDDHDASAAALLKAFKAGFRDFQHMRRDPDLHGLRQHPTYKTILEEADRAVANAAKSALDRWRETYGSKNYRYETDQKRRINYATALDEISHKEMRAMLERQSDQMIESLFGHPPDYDVLIAVPTPDDSDKFFGGNDSIGGMYQHNLRRLVARDIGGSLRHEFFHLMHFAHMERIGQPHPLWIQEGLAALYEDYKLGDDGSIAFLANDRQITVKARAKTGRLVKWRDLFAMTAEQFMDKAQQMYPQVRSIFEFIADQGKLERWYRAYVAHFEDDRTGQRAMEIAFGQPSNEVETEWRRWVSQQPTIDLQIRGDDAALGIRSRENASNDGVLITDIVPRSAAAESRLRAGDVIVSIDGQPTRTLMDLRKIIASRSVGDEVEIRARRKAEYFTVHLKLKPVYSGT